MKLLESAYRHTFPRRVPIVIRVDGKSFHTLTRHCQRPWDDRLAAAMDAVGLALCEEIQGAQVAYIQSDEVSVLVDGYRIVTSEPLDNALQKMVSVSASVATAAFNDDYAGGMNWLLQPGASIDTVRDDGYYVRYTNSSDETARIVGA